MVEFPHGGFSVPLSMKERECVCYINRKRVCYINRKRVCYERERERERERGGVEERRALKFCQKIRFFRSPFVRLRRKIILLRIQLRRLPRVFVGSFVSLFQLYSNQGLVL